MNHQSCEPVHDPAGRVELAGMPLDQRPPGIVKLLRSGWPAAGNGLELDPDLLERLADLFGLDRRAHAEGAGPSAAVERAADSVGQAALFAQTLVEPRRELAAENLVGDEEVVKIRAGTGAIPTYPARTTACAAPGRSSRSSRGSPRPLDVRRVAEPWPPFLSRA